MPQNEYLSAVAAGNSEVFSAETLTALNNLHGLFASKETAPIGLNLVRESARAYSEEAPSAAPLLTDVILRYLLSPIEAYALEAAALIKVIASGGGKKNSAAVALSETPDMLEGLVAVLAHQNINVVERAAWSLGQMAGSGGGHVRDIMLQGPDMGEPMVAVFTRPDATEAAKNSAAWTIANLCQGQPGPNIAQFPPLANFFSKALATTAAGQALTGDEKWLQYILQGAANATSADCTENVGVVVDCRLLEHILAILRQPAAASTPLGERTPMFALLGNPKLRTPVLQLIGNVLAGSDEEADHAINAGVLLLMEEALNNFDLTTAEQREIARNLSNIAVGAPQLTKLFKKPRLVDALATKLLTSRDKKVSEWSVLIMTEVLRDDTFASRVLFGGDSKLLGPTVAAIQGLAKRGVSDVLSVVVDEWGADDAAPEGEEEFFAQIAVAPDAWDKAWSQFASAQAAAEQSPEADPTVRRPSPLSLFKRLCSYIAAHGSP